MFKLHVFVCMEFLSDGKNETSSFAKMFLKPNPSQNSICFDIVIKS